MTKTEQQVQRGCGIDIDSRILWATSFVTTRRGRVTWETESFDNTVEGIRSLSQWLRKNKVSHVAFESTGIYGDVLYSMLEDEFRAIMANPRQIKQLRGRKTDINDSEHIARLLQMGAIRPSFIPPRDVRELRDLSRQYLNLTEDRVRAKNRVTKTLRQAGITLDTCMTDIFGVSGRAIIEALIAGEDPEEAAKKAKGKLRPKIPLIVDAVRFPLSEHYRVLLARYWRSLEFTEAELASIEVEIEQKAKPFHEEIERLCTMVGVGRKTARAVISEIGMDMTAFDTGKHLCSWAKVCPGNNQSGGKRRSGRNSKGNRFIRHYLGEAALAAIRKKGSMFRTLYLRRASRLGKKKAIVSIMNKMLRIMHTMLSLGVDYDDTYDETHHRSTQQASARSAMRQISNEDLVHELLKRGAKNVVWTWDETTQASPT